MGFYSLFRGGEFGRTWSNKLMRLRIALQFTAILILAAWPLVSGTAQDAQVSYKRIPAAWRDVGRNLTGQLPANSRAIVLPGQVFAFYKWGGYGAVVAQSKGVRI